MSVTKESFHKDVENHAMKILHDDDVYRHVQFAEPGTNCMAFNLLTYPYHLVYSGDMGNCIFNRLPDMFNFFGGESPNFGYWCEKLVAIDRDDEAKVVKNG